MSFEQKRTAIQGMLANLSEASFEALALEVFRFQAAHNHLYGRYCAMLKIVPESITQIEGIPFLPIQFFKNYVVKTGTWQSQTNFSSSGTTGDTTSHHHVRDLAYYKKNTVNGFQPFYGDPADWLVLALLPSYLERTGSSLVVMAEHFIRHSKHPKSGFFLNNYEDLLPILHATSPKTLLLGVSFALLDLAERYPMNLSQVTIMETGGMKGRRRELTRTELHDTLKAAFHVTAIHSEYGMTELFSQAYSTGDGLYRPAPTLRAYTRDITDPLSAQLPGKTGVLNLIDLANFDTCSFIATDDLGRVFPDGSFEVLGRLDSSDVRGCNLVIGQ